MVARNWAKLTLKSLVFFIFVISLYSALRHAYAEQFDYFLSELGILKQEEWIRVATYTALESAINTLRSALLKLLTMPWLVACLSGTILLILMCRGWLRWVLKF